MKAYKVAVIGCGRIAGHNCRAVVGTEGLELAAVCDLEIEKVKAQAQIEAAKHNLESYKDAQSAESDKMLRMMEIMQGKKKKEDEE